MGVPANVIYALKLENNNTDESGIYTNTNQGTPAYSSTVKHDNSYSMQTNNATNNFIKAPVALLTDISSLGEWTIEMWVNKYNSDSAYALWFQKGSGVGSAGYLDCYFAQGEKHMDVRCYLGTFSFNYDSPTENGIWQHIAFTYKVSTTTFKVYRNGSLLYTNTTFNNPFSANNGQLWVMGTNDSFNGLRYLDNFIISNIARTSFPTLLIVSPTVTGCLPASGTVAGGTTVTLTGTGFVTGASVKFDTTSATSVSVVSATSITCVTPAHAAGAVNITVTNTDTGAGTYTNGYTYISAPAVTSCTSPKYTVGGETITIGGTGFVTGCVVNINGVNLSTTFVSSTSVTAITQAIAAGTYNVTVTNPDTGTATLTNGITFIVLVFAITNVSPTSGLTNGGQTVTITGSGFLSSALIYIGGQLVSTIYGGTNSLQFITPAHAAGEVSIQVIDYGVTLTWTYSFIYIVGAPEDYTVLINGKDVTGVQIKRFTQKNEINFIDRTNLSFNNIEITAPFNIINLFYKDNNNDIVTVKRNANALFKGYISAKDKDYSTGIYYITASQLLSLKSKTNAALADPAASAPVARMVKLLTDYLPIEYIAPQSTGLDAYFAGISILLNTGTSDTKLLDVILSICELLDFAIFIDDNLIIKIIPLPLAFSNGKDITEALASLPVIKEKKEYYYNAVSLKYYATVGGAEATATAGSGDLALNLSFSNIYFDAASAALITARKLALRNKIYFEAEFTVNKTVVLNIGDSFAFDIYNFIVIYKEETLTSFKIRGLGAGK